MNRTTFKLNLMIFCNYLHMDTYDSLGFHSSFAYHDNLSSMSLKDEENVSTLDPFTHTTHHSNEIRNFDFWVQRQNQKDREKVKIDETFCTLVTVGGKFLEKKLFRNVLMKIHQIRIKF